MFIKIDGERERERIGQLNKDAHVPKNQKIRSHQLQSICSVFIDFAQNNFLVPVLPPLSPPPFSSSLYRAAVVAVAGAAADP